jgi:hypothetical protein
MKRILIIAYAIIGLASPAQAGCTCLCANGQMQPLCSSALDLPPICAPTICPIASPSIPPISPPSIPPIGTSQCRQARICDQFGNCSWQQVCR